MRPTKEVAKESPRRRPPATTPEARENQMAAMAYDLAERQLREGTASSQVITHFLKTVSAKERVEKEILEQKRELIKAQTEALKSAKKVEELYVNALNAMKSYTGSTRGDDDAD